MAMMEGVLEQELIKYAQRTFDEIKCHIETLLTRVRELEGQADSLNGIAGEKLDLLTRVRELEGQAADHAVRAADMAAELKARREILDAITANFGGDGNCWLACAEIDWQQRLQDFAEDSEQHDITREEWKANRDSFPGICLYAVNGFYVGYYDDALELKGQSDDDRPMCHVMNMRPHRTAIHALHLNAWVEHLTDICLPVSILKVGEP